MAQLPRLTRQLIIVGLDSALILLSLYCALWLRFGGLSMDLGNFLTLAATISCVIQLTFFILGLYNIILRHIATQILWPALLGMCAATIPLYYFYFLPLDVVISFAALASLAVTSLRLFIFRIIALLNSINSKLVIIYGAGAAGRQISEVMASGSIYLPIAFLDDATRLHGSVINNIKVFPSNSFSRLINRHKVSLLILAMPSISRAQRRDILKSFSSYRIGIRSLPDLNDLVSGKPSLDDLREIDISEVLGRPAVPPNMELLASCIFNKTVMVTGAGGSIGSELCLQILSASPTCLVLYEISEISLYTVEANLKKIISSRSLNTKLISLLGDVKDSKRLETSLRFYNVNTLYHAAAYKHVPIVEENLSEGVSNNIFGTLSVAEAAAKSGVDSFVLISTDKAVNPTNAMGATKRVAEMILQAFQHIYPNTVFSIVRFGNVLGSSGSVVPLFGEQIKRGGPITVTHPDIVRYFMTIPEAAQLVIQSGAMAKGGEVFVLDMGPPVGINDLARKMIELSGHTVKEHSHEIEGIEIIYTGLRAGEKMFEELLIGGNVTGTNHPMIMCAMEYAWPWSQLEPELQRLKTFSENFDAQGLINVLKVCVPEYQPATGIYDLLHESQPLLSKDKKLLGPLIESMK